MGAYTRMCIARFEEETGIKAATGKAHELLRAAQEEALKRGDLDAIQAFELERCGIRDGDGFWHGGDVLGHYAHSYPQVAAYCELLWPARPDPEFALVW
jgi:hypothetical protein